MEYIIISIIIAVLVYAFKDLIKGRSSHKLEIELVPFNMHGCNVRSRITGEQWKRVCKVVHRQANSGYTCTICNQSGKEQGFPHPVECHEIWEFDESSRTQRLAGMMSLCPMCHKVKHLGLAEKQGFGETARKHLRLVNGMSKAQAQSYINQAVQTVKSRSKVNWTLDLTYLNNSEFDFLGIQFTEDEAENCEKIIF